jgi:hypothetical protein
MTALTSRSNPILADFRDVSRTTIGIRGLAKNWLELMEEDPHMADSWVWAPIRNPRPEEIEHARKVLARFVSAPMDAANG